MYSFHFSILIFNMNKNAYYLFLLGLMALLAVGACNFDPNKGLSWNADIIAPIATSEVGIFDIAPDSLLSLNSDNTMNIVFRDTVFKLRPTALVDIPDTSLKQALSLGTLSINSDTISQKITLGQMLRQVIAQGGLNGSIAQDVYNSHGQLGWYPPIDSVGSDLISIDASQFFEYAEIESGYMSLTIFNQLPVNITYFRFGVKNATFGTTIIHDTFPPIPAYTNHTKLYDMAGKTVESALQAQVEKATTGVNFEVIDTNAFIRIALKAVNLKAHRAIAAFPNQTVIDSVRNVDYSFKQGVQLTKIGLKEGKIKISAYSTLEDTVGFFYELLSATDMTGTHPSAAGKIPPASPGNPTQTLKETSLAGATLDLSKNGTTFNTYQEHFKIDLLSSGALVDFDQQDSVFLFFGLVDLVPNYVEGYIGKDTFFYTGTKAFEVFKKFNIDRLQVENPKMTISLLNSIGADAKLEMKNIKFSNTKKGTSVNFNADWLAQPQYLSGPRLPNVGGMEITSFYMDKNNSNIPQIINLLPDQVSYNARVTANYNGVSGVRNNFATDSSMVAAYLDFELPLEGIVENFAIQDTVDVNFSASVKPQDYERVKKATLKLLLYNGFPFQATVDATFYDENWNLVADMANAFVLNAGTLVDGYVQHPMLSTYSKTFENPEINDILQRSRHLKLRYRMDTKPNNSSVKIYSTYRIKAKMVGQFMYKLGA